MKTTKIIFVVGLINFFIVTGVLGYSKIFTTQTAVQINDITPTPSITLTSPTLTTPQNSTATPDPMAGKCIIYVRGARYDVTEFKKIHEGGDIFQCGTDMTEIFNDQHASSYLAKIAKYKI